MVETMGIYPRVIYKAVALYDHPFGISITLSRMKTDQE